MVVATAAEVAAIAGAQASRRHADSTNGEGDPTVQGMLADKVLLEQRLAACATFSDRDQPSENAGELVATRRAAKRAAKALDAAANSKRKKTEGATQPTQAPLPTVTTTDAITTTTAMQCCQRQCAPATQPGIEFATAQRGQRLPARSWSQVEAY